MKTKREGYKHKTLKQIHQTLCMEEEKKRKIRHHIEVACNESVKM